MTKTLPSIHRIVLEAFGKIIEPFDDTNCSHFTVYFEHMCIASGGGREMMSKVFDVEKMSLVSSLLPDVASSHIHLKIAQGLLNSLNDIDNSYRVDNEFYGFKSRIFPVDCAVYHNDVLVGLLEIDGKDHYKQLVTGKHVLRRVDKLKEFMYAKQYPNVKFVRKRNPKIDAAGLLVFCRDLAREVAGLRA